MVEFGTRKNNTSGPVALVYREDPNRPARRAYFNSDGKDVKRETNHGKPEC